MPVSNACFADPGSTRLALSDLVTIFENAWPISNYGAIGKRGRYRLIGWRMFWGVALAPDQYPDKQWSWACRKLPPAAPAPGGASQGPGSTFRHQAAIPCGQRDAV
ncbi:hypothetical protein GCM10010833_16680 [Blastomonas aquatica]|uniref:Uncharacterized protein n=1 Tax=Blastomonas aquatica TaxID=1510276 RepID=A0ABQ1J852_9SPHN|nr:hypothetical protein GCM10010833_16680 [Blastomonas aquatica]